MFKVVSGFGGMARPKVGEKYKTSTHPVLLYTCTKCQKSTIRRFTRMKKVSQV